jgi:integrase
MAKYGSGSVYLRGKTWWIRGPGINRQSAETNDKKQAQATLKVKLAEAVNGRQCGTERATVADILQLVLNNYKLRERRTTQNVEIQIKKHLEPALGKIRIADLRTKDIDQYRKLRKSEPGHGGNFTTNATINRELAVLRRGLTLGRREEPPMVLREFYIEMLPENNIRQGFLRDEDYEALLAALPEHLRALAGVGYETGIRKDQLRQLKWRQVDFERRVIIWYPNQTKGGVSHDIPFMGDMESLLLDSFKRHQNECPNCPFVFHFEGRRIGDFRKSWATACKRAGVPSLLFHDLRRTAGRRLEDAGVPRSVAMRITGHKTESMYLRYAGVRNSDDLQDAARKVKVYRDSRKQAQNLAQRERST